MWGHSTTLYNPPKPFQLFEITGKGHGRGFSYRPVPIDYEFVNEFKGRFTKGVIEMARVGVVEFDWLKKTYEQPRRLAISHRPSVSTKSTHHYKPSIPTKDTHGYIPEYKE